MYCSDDDDSSFLPDDRKLPLFFPFVYMIASYASFAIQQYTLKKKGKNSLKEIVVRLSPSDQNILHLIFDLRIE